ncbi:MAG: ABC transporter ATP-binding protein [Candidatus Lokiarchaeota archaeon]|nr:ABC transporter ATP-binding protein [Candidatus Lokiarchaeota archaeon]
MLHGVNKAIVVGWLLLIFTSAALTSAVAIVIGQAIDGFVLGDQSAALASATLVLVFGISAPAFGLSGNLLREKLAQRVEWETRAEFFTSLLGKDQSFHDRQRTGDVMARATEDVRLLNFMVSPALSLIVEAAINTALPIVLTLLNYPAQLAAVPVAFSILFVVAIRKYIRDLTPPTQQNRIEFGLMDATLNEGLEGIDVIKAMAREDEARKKFLLHASLYRDAARKEGFIQARYVPLLLVALATTAGLVHALVLHAFQGFQVGQVIAYTALLLNLRFPTFISIWAFAIVREAVSGAERLLEVMNGRTAIDQNVAGRAQRIEGRVVFDRVTFSYPGSTKPVLRDVSFEVEPGETVAIVGTTGSGKTTLTKLLSRLYDVTTGRVLVDGVPIQEYSLEALRSQIAFIEQDIFLFSTSIAENISFGRTGTRDDIIAAAKDAQAHEFIMALPRQYDTLLGQDGVQLSGGERQRVAIARAFLSDPRILVLDDATSAIDSATEERIQRAMNGIKAGRTTFLITHRLSQIRWADVVLVLKRGQVVAKGTHDELLRTSEEYRRIFVKRFDLTVDQLLKGGVG